MLYRLRSAFLAALLAASGLAATPTPAHARTGLSVGMTVQASELSAMYATYGTAPDSVRVFSSTGPPPWSDSRIQSLKAHGIVPFISHKTYNPTVFRSWLLAMPADIPKVYLAHHHEAEADMSAATYISRQRAYWNVVQGLPTSLRARVKYGPIQTKQWTENTSGRSYATYDPGIGDFWAVDAYVNTWGLAYPNASTWMSKLIAYNTCRPTCRPKWLPELGVVSMPNDPDDTGRAAWINSVRAVLESHPGFQLVMWWNTVGTSGGSVQCLGTARNFRLHEKRLCDGRTVQVTPSVDAWRDFMAANSP